MFVLTKTYVCVCVYARVNWVGRMKAGLGPSISMVSCLTRISFESFFFLSVLSIFVGNLLKSSRNKKLENTLIQGLYTWHRRYVEFVSFLLFLFNFLGIEIYIESKKLPFLLQTISCVYINKYILICYISQPQYDKGNRNGYLNISSYYTHSNAFH